jgi:hypothetical protein
MRSNVPFAALSGLLAAIYFWIAYTSPGSNAGNRNDELLTSAVLYGPLVVAVVFSLLCKTDEQIASLPWLLIVVLTLSTIFMASLGWDMPGALLGLVNMVLCWILVVRVLMAFGK